MRTHRTFAPALVLAATANAFAIIPDYGADTFFNGVGTLSGASCVAISSNWVITAKHVGGSTVNFGSGNLTAIQRYDHVDADISLLKFAPGSFATFYGADFTSALGREVALVGYGGTGTPGATGVNLTPNSGGVRRAGANTIDAAVNATFDNIHFFDCWMYDLDGPTGNGSLGGAAVFHEAGLWYGDSGGAWLVNNGGSFNLVAVNSWIDDANANNAYNDWGDYGGGVALSSYQGWIQSTMAVPEPGTLAVIGLGLAALARRRRS